MRFIFVCEDNGWLMQPHLARVILIELWGLGEAAHLLCLE